MQGFVSGMSDSIIHQIISEFFENKYKTKAYFAFQFIVQLGNSL